MRRAKPVVVDQDQKQVLARWSRGRKSPARLVLRAKIVLSAAEGVQNDELEGLKKEVRKRVGELRDGLGRGRLHHGGVPVGVRAAGALPRPRHVWLHPRLLRNRVRPGPLRPDLRNGGSARL